MSSFRRAFLYVTRKRTKNIILLFIIFIVATLALSAIALRSAVETAQLNVRQALGGYFAVSPNTEDSSKWETPLNADGTSGERRFIGEMPSTALAESISSQIDGLSGFSLSSSYRARICKDLNDKEDLSLVPCGNGYVDARMQSDIYQSSVEANDYYISFGLQTCTNSSLDYNFVGKALSLIEGRHIDASETGVAIISEELAERNGLTIGDTIYLRDLDSSLKTSGKTEVEYAPVSIVGLFELHGTYENEFSCDGIENMIFTTQNTLKSYSVDSPNDSDSYENLYFYAEDPVELESMAETLSTFPQFGRDGDFTVSINNRSILLVEGPLTNINQLITILILLVLIVGVIILWLVLSSQIKSRIHETGIFLSIGIGKANILLQYIIEITVITLIACTIAVFSSSIISKTAGNLLLQDTITSVTEEQDVLSPAISQSLDDSEEQNTQNSNNTASTSLLTEISVSIQASDVLLLFIAVLLLAWLAVFIASISLFRLKPREILSKMS